MGAGYVPPDKYEVKRKHRQLNKLLCERCSGLCNGAMIPAVQVRCCMPCCACCQAEAGGQAYRLEQASACPACLRSQPPGFRRAGVLPMLAGRHTRQAQLIHVHLNAVRGTCMQQRPHMSLPCPVHFTRPSAAQYAPYRPLPA
jgi:hypothetical protein